MNASGNAQIAVDGIIPRTGSDGDSFAGKVPSTSDSPNAFNCGVTVGAGQTHDTVCYVPRTRELSDYQTADVTKRFWY